MPNRLPLAKKSRFAAPCELLELCGFFKKHQATKNLACRGFMRIYCMGSKQSECKRKQYRDKHGVPPSDDMMPSGHEVVPENKTDRDRF